MKPQPLRGARDQQSQSGRIRGKGTVESGLDFHFSSIILKSLQAVWKSDLCKNERGNGLVPGCPALWPEQKGAGAHPGLAHLGKPPRGQESEAPGGREAEGQVRSEALGETCTETGRTSAGNGGWPEGGLCFHSSSYRLVSPGSEQAFLLWLETHQRKEMWIKNSTVGTSLAAQCLRIHLPMQGTQVQSLGTKISCDEVQLCLGADITKPAG